ncbi:3-phenylpropionate/cinnamic acid dioxygenase ferredoxin--NAD(+) reductase component [Streptomyces tendae]
MSAPEPAGHVLVVGAGQAGHQTAAALRERGHRGPVTLVGDEGVLPYERPALSKSYLKRETDTDQLWLRPPTFYERHGIARVQGAVAALDRAARTVRLADGTVLGYDHLVLATGARARTLPVPGGGLAGVHTLRTLRDADRIREDLARARQVVVVGAGFIGRHPARRDPDRPRPARLRHDHRRRGPLSRSLNIDFLLGYLSRLLPKRRDLQVGQHLGAHRPRALRPALRRRPTVIEVSGRTYPWRCGTGRSSKKWATTPTGTRSRRSPTPSRS